MKPVHLLGLSAAMSMLLICAAAKTADAQPPPVGGGPRHLPPPPAGGPILGFPGVYVVEREVVRIVEREIVREEPKAPVAAAAPPPPRQPYAIGNSYSSLPGGCMKLIQDGVSYYHCSGEWYRQMGASYKAIAKP